MPSNSSPNCDRRSVLKAAGSLGAIFGSTGLASAAAGREPDSDRTELLVGVSASASDVEGAVQPILDADASVVHSNEAIRYAAVELPEQASDQVHERISDSLESADEIEYVEENATIESLHTPNDPRYSSQHAPSQVNCEGAWDTTLGGDDVVISVVDQAVQYDHENLEANVDDQIGEVFVGGGSDPYPVNSSESHGTRVAGLAVGGTDNGTGQAGISNCSFLSARAMDESGRGSLSDIADAIQWSADQGTDVINLSLASSSDWRTLENACEYAFEQGCLLVGGAGNNGGAVQYPAAYDSVIAVSALDADNSLSSFSNRGSQIELAAPGRRVLSTDLNDSYTRVSGTSMATPIVSGVAGLVLSAYPGLSVEQLRDHLRATAADVGLSSNAQGYGRIDADAAVNTVPDGYEADDGEQGDGETDEDDEAEDHLLAFITEPDARGAGYEFTADGPVEFADAPYDSPSGGDIEGGTFVAEDFIEEDDGTWHAGGVTGGGHGDAFRVDGAVTSIDLDQPEGMWIELDGEERSVEEVIEATSDDEGDDEDERSCGEETETAEVEGSLISWWNDRDGWRYNLRTADPCSVTVSIDGPSDADFGLYANFDGTQPSTSSHDESSTGEGSEESITVDLDGDETVRMLVHADAGSGSYTLSIEERGR
ncbi:S8 family peptidase [Natrialbaceae archaeon A-arb3/5]